MGPVNIVGTSRSHVNEDLRPYVCISEDCGNIPPSFATRDDWRAHMQTKHRSDWVPYIHRPQHWICPLNDSAVCQFPSQNDLLKHLETVHSGDIPGTDLVHIATKSKIPMPLRANVCPLCAEEVTLGPATREFEGAFGNIASTGEKEKPSSSATKVTSETSTPATLEGPSSQSDQGPKRNLTSSKMSVLMMKMEKHIASHMESAALWSLRWWDDNLGGLDHDSQQASADSRPRPKGDFKIENGTDEKTSVYSMTQPVFTLGDATVTGPSRTLEENVHGDEFHGNASTSITHFHAGSHEASESEDVSPVPPSGMPEEGPFERRATPDHLTDPVEYKGTPTKRPRSLDDAEPSRSGSRSESWSQKSPRHVNPDRFYTGPTGAAKSSEILSASEIQEKESRSPALSDSDERRDEISSEVDNFMDEEDCGTDNDSEEDMAESLARKVERSLFDQKKEFWPRGTIDGIITRERVRDRLKLRRKRSSKETQETRKAEQESLDKLADFISRRCKKIFAIMLCGNLSDSDIRQALSQFQQLGFDDGGLPAVEDNNTRVFYSSTAKAYRKPWNHIRVGAFCSNQWKFLAPVFDNKQSEMALHRNHILPFIKASQRAGAGTFGEVHEVTIHPAHRKNNVHVRPFSTSQIPFHRAR